MSPFKILKKVQNLTSKSSFGLKKLIYKLYIHFIKTWGKWNKNGKLSFEWLKIELASCLKSRWLDSGSWLGTGFELRYDRRSIESGPYYEVRESVDGPRIISLSWACIPPEPEVVVSPCRDKPTGTPEPEGCGTSDLRTYGLALITPWWWNRLVLTLT